MDPTPTRRAARTWLLGVALLFLVRLVGELTPLMGPAGWIWTTRLAELWLAGGLVVWGLRDYPLSATAREIGPRRAVAAGALLLGMLLGQLVGPGSNWHPFGHWDMYTVDLPEVEYAEVWLTDAAGVRSRLDISAAGLNTEPRTISGRILEEARAATGGDAGARQLVEDTITVVTDLDWRTAEVRSCVVAEPTAEDPARCSVVLTLERGSP